ncbi:N-acetylglucosaminylphosphatidylinositol deacetylase [Malassezia japonica]|uniref:N-acetylglucosaminylphosphatidylinositol deacetylase n=1 Tax=Malassezia japonica TaxID=223818 RepID=A0AAF0F253_9BASI|nr:N-acetylglucosaminylphosphatidylinositol deacetylase [Malassezia japonica]WFD39137.1 N-acetylglucosaminylphosphatidylinositol deacetylase [Malassezia japonica]
MLLDGAPVAVLPWKHVLVVTAHPDDECMFFGPTLQALLAHNVSLSALCLSQGNADGLGVRRQAELVASYGVLGVPRENVTCLDDALLQDGMTTVWDADYILTFDAHGVSGHPNHMAVHFGARRVQSVAKIPRLDVLSLDTRSVASKYTGIAAAMWDRLWPQRGLQTLAHPIEYGRSLAAMREHASQLVWFRYMHVNAVSIDHS